jgi:uncharacterized phage infection (PIP) family protein YhgE
MSKVKEVDDNLKQIFDELDEANEYQQRLTDELIEENQALWRTIDGIAKILKKEIGDIV